ncbi:MAG: riboflavin synthase [Burkholderiaceae bacterium]|jgi:riboflavin synthase|nr:riboflavin synthase [Burkholderiales bacterium]MCZ8107076.1 riboflavin synthase [Burkholderiales bacterium]MCZ8341076.1 riboflavin synthase [Burkholderiaceae bacterium]
MFTGIVAAVGRIERVDPLGEGAGLRLTVEAGGLGLQDVAVGDSISIQGACMTAISVDATRFVVEVSRESLSKTVGLDAPGEVNLEKALRLADRLGGHLVSGHVDGIGEVAVFEPVGESWRLDVRVPAPLSRYLAYKGSVTIDGTSLTVNRVTDLPGGGCDVSINLIPHTIQATTLKRLAPGAKVNLEIDLIARYVERMLGDARASVR